MTSTDRLLPSPAARSGPATRLVLRARRWAARGAIVAVLGSWGPVGCGGGGGGGDQDAGPPPPDGGLGDVPCATDDDCPAGSCVNLTRTRGLETGYCSLSCAETADCAPMVDGQTYECIDLGPELGASCIRVCRDGFGCALGTDLCVALPLGGATRDACLDTRRLACTADRDCDDGRFCLPVTDREGLAPICVTPTAPEGAPEPLEPERLGVGSPCDHPGDPEGPGADFCTDPDECPGGRCLGRAEGARACFPPPEERCALFCNPFGQCAGLCDDDADCPAAMRCSRVTTALPQADPDVFDDTWVEQGLCTYADGSRTPCLRESDCATTGPGGARETCLASVDGSGEVGSICVTPAAGVGLPGDLCGDDPATDAVEVRPCHGTCESFRCRGRCEGGDDCGPGESCRPILLDAQRTATFCVPDGDCERDADCPRDEVCVPSATADTFEGRCEPPGGALPAGTLCQVTDEGNSPLPFEDRCRLGCLEAGAGPTAGRCSAACSSSEDCPEDLECVVEERTLVNGGTLDRSDDTSAALRYCRYLPSIGETCEEPGDCGSDETCVSYRPAAGGAVRRRCVTAEAGAPLTASCRGAVPCRDRDCFEDWFEPEFPYCTAPCSRDADCPGDFECHQVLRPDRENAPRQCVRPDDPRIVGR